MSGQGPPPPPGPSAGRERSPDRARRPSRFGLFYLTHFMVLGIYLPYFNLYLESLGFDGLQIGILAAAIPLGKVVFGPLWSLWSDRIGRRRGIALTGAAAATAAFGLTLGVRRFLPLCAVLYLYSALLSPLLPLVEATALELAERRRWHYGRIRVWGSVGFIATALLFGPLLDRVDIRSVLPGILAVSLLNLLATAALPDASPRPAWRRGDLTPSFLRPAVVAFFGCTLLMQASHGAYYAFFSIVLEDAGFRRGTIGALWTLGVLAEMVTMISSRWLLGRLGVAALMSACAGLAAVRWGIYAGTVWLPAVLAAQLLHAFTFGAFHVAAVTGTHRLFPPQLRSSGQSLFSGLTYGAGSAVGFLGAGALFQWGGPSVLFLASAATAVGALALSAPLWRERSLREETAIPLGAPAGGRLE